MKTHWKKLDNPNYLGAYSLMDGNSIELVVTIQKVVLEDVKSERGTEKCKIMYLEGQKPMILNNTNSKTISKVLKSPFIEDWAGHKITLFVAEIKAFGDVVDALRVRPSKPQIPELTPSHTSWEKAKKALDSGNYSINDLKKKYIISPKNEKLLCSK